MMIITMTIIIIRLLVVRVQQQPDNGAATQTKMSVLVNLRPLNPNAKQIKLPSIFA
jgi:hypothetical protein